jgi:hemolysin activation/secretion protein
MVVQASVVGVFRTLLALIGAIVFLKFIGQLLQAKKNLAAEQQWKESQQEYQQDERKVRDNFGKTTVLNAEQPIGPKDHASSFAEDVDFEEIP